MLRRLDLGGVAEFAERNSKKLFFQKIPKKDSQKMGTFVFLSVSGDGQMNAKQDWYLAKFFGKCCSL